MPIRDVLVHVDASGADASAIRFAAALAARHGARLTGLFLRTELPAGKLFVGAPADTHAELAAQAGVEIEAVAAGLPSRLPWRLTTIPYRSPSETLKLALEAAFLADLVVVGQHVGAGHTAPADLAEELILKSGRPLVSVPPQEIGEAAAARVVVAWRPGREAARALHDSMPVLSLARQVVVIDVGEASGASPRTEMIEHLRAHGIEATAERLAADGLDVAEALLSRANQHKADLLVVGAHAGYGMPMLGPGTLMRHMLARARIPVMFGY